ncbi:MAG: hypothetical protein AABY32_07435 [Nanoarchaeota archaeon]
MEPSEEEIRKTLDKLFENVENIEDEINFKFLLEQYLEAGYNVRGYVDKYNDKFTRNQ